MNAAQDQKTDTESTLNLEPQAVVVRREPERDLVVWTAQQDLLRGVTGSFMSPPLP
jgi:hypothetical protein